MKISCSRKAVLKTVTALAALWIIAELIARFVAAIDHNGGVWDYSAGDYIAAYGLDTSKVQPLTLGSDITGSQGKLSGNFTGSGFILYGEASGSISGSTQPASSVRLGMDLKGKSYILEIPYSKVAFVQQPNAKATARFTVTATNDINSNIPARDHIGSFWLFSPHHLLPAPPAERTPDWNDGPAAILENGLQSVVLTVTPKEYKAYLGSK